MTELELQLCEQILKIQGTLIHTAPAIGTVTLKQTVDHAVMVVVRAIASDKFRSGVKPSYSTGICGSTTAGYGYLDQNGYFQFPLYVNQTSHEAHAWN